ncbi:hypothetical protein C8255_07875 [filamentous cyanobacterium CCP3]|nr:hypothetical protein C8255_07875 [filamentous cyanobacterium CCP3]
MQDRSGFFSRLHNGVESSYQKGESNIPYLGTDSEPFEDPYTRFLAELLEAHAPELLSRFRRVVVESARQLKHKEEYLQSLEEKKIQLVGELEAKSKALDHSLSQLPKEPSSTWVEFGLTVGLSVLLFIGVLTLFEVQIRSAFDSRNYIKTIIALSAAICINLAERKTVEHHAQHNAEVKNERLSQMLDKADNSILSLSDDRRAFWSRIAEGESPIWLAGTIVVSETAFVSAGLLDLLVTAPWTLQAAAIIGASLAALINVALAWGMALEKASWKRDFLKKKQQIIVEQFENMQAAASADARLKEINENIEDLKRKIKNDRQDAAREYRRWERDLKGYLQVNSFNSNNTHSSHTERQ